MISELFAYHKKALTNMSTIVTAIKESDIKTLKDCKNTAAKETIKGTVKLGVYLASGNVLDSLTSDTPLEGIMNLSIGTVFKAVDCFAIATNVSATIMASAAAGAITLKSYGQIYRSLQVRSQENYDISL